MVFFRVFSIDHFISILSFHHPLPTRKIYPQDLWFYAAYKLWELVNSYCRHWLLSSCTYQENNQRLQYYIRVSVFTFALGSTKGQQATNRVGLLANFNVYIPSGDLGPVYGVILALSTLTCTHGLQWWGCGSASSGHTHHQDQPKWQKDHHVSLEPSW